MIILKKCFIILLSVSTLISTTNISNKMNQVEYSAHTQFDYSIKHKHNKTYKKHNYKHYNNIINISTSTVATDDYTIKTSTSTVTNNINNDTDNKNNTNNANCSNNVNENANNINTNINNTDNTNCEENKETLINIDIPRNTYSKPYEDGKYINCTSSKEYQTLKKCSIDEKGHYRLNEYYAVAMGTYFSDVGSKYLITLDTGKSFKVIKVDTKDDKDVTNYMIDQNGGIIEFIIDENTAYNYYGVGDNGYVLNGSYNNTDEFNGNIIKIEEIKGD